MQIGVLASAVLLCSPLAWRSEAVSSSGGLGRAEISPSGAVAGGGETRGPRRAASAGPRAEGAVRAAPGRRGAALVSGWVLLVLASERRVSAGAAPPQWLDVGLREALAEALGVCRASVRVVQSGYVATHPGTGPEPITQRRLQHASLLRQIQQFMRRARGHPSRTLHMSRIKSLYEVRVFDEMRTNESEVARRIDNLQIYSRFSEFSRMLGRTTYRGSSTGVILDDLGYASRHLLDRQPLSRGELVGCVEEEILYDARRAHQYIVFIAIVLVALTACVGSAVFAIKHPSIVPSRLNPLTRAGEEAS